MSSAHILSDKIYENLNDGFELDSSSRLTQNDNNYYAPLNSSMSKFRLEGVHGSNRNLYGSAFDLQNDARFIKNLNFHENPF